MYGSLRAMSDRIISQMFLISCHVSRASRVEDIDCVVLLLVLTVSSRLRLVPRGQDAGFRVPSRRLLETANEDETSNESITILNHVADSLGDVMSREDLVLCKHRSL